MTYVIYDNITLSLLEWDMFQTKVVQKIKTLILCSVNYFRKSYRIAIMWKKI